MLAALLKVSWLACDVVRLRLQLVAVSLHTRPVMPIPCTHGRLKWHTVPTTVIEDSAPANASAEREIRRDEKTRTECVWKESALRSD